MKKNSQHPTFERLADMAEGRLDPAQERETRAHLDACPRCAASASTLERVVTLMRADATEDAPRDLIFNAVRLFDARRANDALPGRLRRLVASLTFDSLAPAQAFGVRSAAETASARQMLFNAGEVEVDLRLNEGGAGWTIAGQVLGACEEETRAALHAEGGREVASAELNDLCEFVLPPVPAGDYTLRLTVGGAEIEIPGLTLKG